MKWLEDHFDYKSSAEAPTYLLEPYITHGYRMSPCSPWYCVRHLFGPNNETMNVLTHLLPAVAMMFMYIQFTREYLHNWATFELILIPYYFFVFGWLTCLFGSAFAHLFNCMSAGWRQALFCFDYLAISFRSLGGLLVYHFYVCPFTCIPSMKFVSTLMYVLCMLVNIANVSLICQTRYPQCENRYLKRVLPYATSYILINLPCCWKYFYSYPNRSYSFPYFPQITSGSVCDIGMLDEHQYNFAAVVASTLLAGIFQATKFPERLSPGSFNVIGHSHNLLHIFTALSCVFETNLIHSHLAKLLRQNSIGSITYADLGLTTSSVVWIPLLTIFISTLIAGSYALDMFIHLHYSRKNSLKWN